MPRRPVRLLAVLLAVLALAPAARADDDDTRFLLDQTRRAAERRVQPSGDLVAPPGAIVHEGQIYAVPTNVQALEPAIYVALNTSQWDRLEEFISRYRLLRDHRPGLVAMAEGLLARQRGDHARALRRMQAAHAAEPNDTRIRLELARLQFEDNQDANARATFALAQTTGLPDYGRVLTEQYLAALKARDGWHGSVALGLGYNSNINLAKYSSTCLSEFLGYCLFERNMPAPVRSSLWNYEMSLERRFNLGGNHNLLVRPISYGSFYHHENPVSGMAVQDFSSRTSLLYLGYQYLDARNSISLLPYLEHYYRDGYTNYIASGVQAEWRRILGRRWQLGGSLDARRSHHKEQALRIASDYSQFQAGLSLSFMPDNATSIYGGLDLTRRRYAIPQASTKEIAVRAGVYHSFEGSAGLYLNALGIYRVGLNDAFDGFLGDRRRDRQQVIIVSVGASNWKIAGMTPELRWRRNQNRSNLDWAYGFTQDEVTLMLRRSF